MKRNYPTILLLLILMVLAPKALWAFSFENFQTTQGLRVWLVPLPDSHTVNVVLHIPVGGTQDPKGREGLAHFVEHMLFTDNDGRDELEFFKELEKKGGKANGYTSKEDTFYVVEAPASEVDLSLDWARRLLFDHKFKEAAVDKERKIVMLEANLSPKEPLDYLLDLRRSFSKIFSLPNFLQREFGVKEDDRQLSGTYETLGAVNLQDVQAFYDTHYPASAMTLFISGNFKAATLKDQILRKFAAKNPNTSTFGFQAYNLKNPKRYRQEYFFLTSGALRYSRTQKLYSPKQKDVLYALFLEDFLGEFLNDELRFKDRSTYGVQTDLFLKKNVATFSVYGDFASENFAASKLKINETLQNIKDNQFSAETFAEYRKRALDTLLLRSKTPEFYSRQFQSYYFNQAVFSDFPDLEAFYANVSSEDLSNFLKQWFVKENQLSTFNVRSPISKGTEMVILFVGCVLFLLFLRWHWIKPLDLRGLAYMRKLYWSLPLWIIFLMVFWALFFFYLETIDLAGDFAKWFYIGLPSYWAQSFFDLVALFGYIYLFVLPFTMFPRKILLFQDFLLIKFLTFRSWRIAYKDLFLFERIKPWQLFNFRRYGFTLKLNPVFSKGIYVKGKKYPGVFFSTRNDAELLKVMETLLEKNSKT